MSLGKEVAVDFWGPINTGKYLLVTVCKQSRWAEVEFVTSTSARAVILKMDKTFASLGIPVSVSSDNGPPFNSQDFRDPSKYLGFRHERKSPLNPQAICRGRAVHESTEEAVPNKQVDGIEFQARDRYSDFFVPTERHLIAPLKWLRQI